MGLLFHLTTEAEWARYQGLGEIRPEGLAREGFVHASWAGQVLGSAERHFAGHDALVLLGLAVERIPAEVVEEDLYGRGAFPHVYGPIPLAAVDCVEALERGDDGRFVWPDGVPQG